MPSELPAGNHGASGPAWGASTVGRLDRVLAEPASGQEPGGEGVARPHLARSKLIPTPVSGTTWDLVVPAGPNCLLQGATIKHDVIVEENGFLNAASTTIGHDLVAYKPQQVGTGIVNDVAGPVTVGHDIVVNGPLTDQFGNHTCCPDVIDTTVGHDLRITNLLVDFEISVQRDNVGHDLVVSGNSTGLCCGFGPIDLGDNSVGHDLVVSGNTTAGGDFGWISVFENRVGHDAICSANSPSASRNTRGQLEFLGRSVGPNQAGHDNSCG